MRDTPIEKLKFHYLKSECPKELEDYLELVIDLQDKYRELENYLYNYGFGQIYLAEVTKTLLDFVSMNNIIMTGFLSIVRSHDTDDKYKKKEDKINEEDKQKNKKEEEKIEEQTEAKKTEESEQAKKEKPKEDYKKISDSLDEDFSNFLAHMNVLLQTTFIGPSEKRTHGNLSFITQQLIMPFNMLIGPVLLETHKNSLRERPRIKYHLSGRPYQVGMENYCEPELFYKKLFESLYRYVGIFKKQLFILAFPKGKQAFFSTFQPQQTKEPTQQDTEKSKKPEKSPNDYVEISDFEGDLDAASEEELDEDETV